MNARNDKMAQMNGYFWVGQAFQAAADSERREYARHAGQRVAEAQLATPARPGLLRRLLSALMPVAQRDSIA